MNTKTTSQFCWLIAAIVLLIGASTSQAVVRTWIGTPTGTSDFTTTTRWSPNGAVDDSADTLIFTNSGTAGSISDNTDSQVVWNDVQFTGNNGSGYTISVQNWTLNAANQFITVDAAVSNNETLNFNRAGTLNYLYLRAGTSTILNNGSGLLSIGSTQVPANGAAIRPLGTTAAGNATLRVDGTGNTLIGGLATGNMALVNNTAAILSLTKLGTGTLTINSSGNTFSGGATITAGTVVLNNTGSYNSTLTYGVLGSGAMNIQSGGQVRVVGNFNIGKGQTINLAGGTLTAVGGANYLHNLNITAGGHVTTDGGGFAFGFAQNSIVTLSGTAPAFISSNLQMVKNTGSSTLATFNIANVTGDSAADLTVSGVIFDNPSYTGLQLVKSGDGTLLLTTNNTYIGGTTLSAGTLRVTHTSGLGTGTLTANSGTLQLLNDGTGNNGTITYGNNITTGSANTLNIAVGNNGANTGNTIVLGGNYILGNSTINFTGANGYSVNIGTLNIAGGSSGTAVLNPTTATLTIGTVNNSNASAHTLQLDGTGAGNAITGNITQTAGTLAITKANTSVWTLFGNNTYTGATTISNGTLLVNGSLAAASAVNVAGGTLGGTGTIGNVTIQNTGTLAPGNSAGVFNVGDLTLASGAQLAYDLDTPGTSDQVIAAGTLTLNGQQFTDFTFALTGNFTTGVYTLIDATAVSGSLGANLTGTLNGLQSTLSVSGNDLILSVIPEPSTWALVAIALVPLFLRRRFGVRQPSAALPFSRNQENNQ